MYCQLECQLYLKTPINTRSIGVFVKAEGFEPSTACLEGRCSIQLSYASIAHEKKLVGVAGFEPATSCSQSRRDNRATLHPEKQLDKYDFYYLKMLISKHKKNAEGQGLEPWHRLLGDSLANCSITTLAPLQAQRNMSCFAVANLELLCVTHNYFYPFFLWFSTFL
jgi:hypothetical protein